MRITSNCQNPVGHNSAGQLDRRSAALLAFAAVVACDTSSGQCIARWSGRYAGESNQLDGAIRALALFDADGPAPGPQSIYVAGEFTKAGFTYLGGIARRSGVRWEELGGGLNGPAYAILAVPGEAATLERGLYVGGSFATAGSAQALNIARWDGQSWHAFGSGLPAAVTAFSIFDQDGNGPIEPRLFAGSSAGVSRWDGLSWTTDPIAAVNGPAKVLALIEFDDDGVGPAMPMLVAGGRFRQIGGVEATNVARWDGASWSAMGTGLGLRDSPWEDVRTFVVHDEDGDGSSPGFLVAGGSFSIPFRTRSLARWNGTEWVYFGGLGSSIACSRLRSLDLDGSGPLTPTLFAAGYGPPAFHRRDGSQWIQVESTRYFPPIFDMLVDTNEGGDSNVLTLGGGDSSSRFGLFTQFIDDEWQSPWVDTGLFTSPVTALAAFDLDGPGGGPLLLFAGTRKLYTWDGHRWSISDFEFNRSIRTMELVDLDAAGPSPPQIAIAAGSEVGLWDGTALRRVASVSGFSVIAIRMFDSDGDGPAPPRMYSATSDAVLAYDPLQDQWALAGFSRDIRDMTVFDRDGPGPLHERLYVSSESTYFNGGSYYTGHVARYDGVNWSATGAADLAGPAERLLVGPDVTNPGGPAAMYAFAPYAGGPDPDAVWLLRWSPPNWVPVGTAPVGSTGAAVPFDLDADGVSDTIVRVTGSALERLDDGVFVPFSSGARLDAPGRALAVAPARTFASNGPSLFVGGEFFGVGEIASRHFAHWRASPPGILESPEPRFATAGRSIRLTVAASGSEPLAFQWRKDGVPLSDDERVSGATTAEMTISNLETDDAGVFDVVVTDDCGITPSESARLTISGSDCPADIDGDRFVGLQDLANLLSRFAEVGPALGNEDIDADHAIDLDDLALLLANFGQECP